MTDTPSAPVHDAIHRLRGHLQQVIVGQHQVIDEVLAMDLAKQAFARLASNATFGKLVLRW